MLEKETCEVINCILWGINFCLEPASSSNKSSIFGFGEYLATLALLLVIFTVTDFQYRFRLSLTKVNLKILGFGLSFFIGVLVFLTDFWFQNNFLVPGFLNNQNNIKFGLGGIFLLLIFYLYFRSFVRPAVFGKGNAKNYFLTIRHFVGEGNPERLAVVASEIGFSTKEILNFASKIPEVEKSEEKEKFFPKHVGFAHDLVLIFGNKKLCKAMVEKVPWAAAEIFTQASILMNPKIPIWQFAKNVGEELILNTESSLYHEEDGFTSGYFGYTKPVSRAIFGNSTFVELCASNHRSPLAISFSKSRSLNPTCLRGFGQASLLFAEDYFSKKNPFERSFALNQLLEVFEWANGDLRNLDGIFEYWHLPESERLRITVDFIRDLITQLDESEIQYRGPLKSKKMGMQKNQEFDAIANLIFEIIFSASSVKTPRSTNWNVQHNQIWGDLFDFGDSKTLKIINFKVKRLLYEEITKLDEYPSYKAVKILGFCLNVLGLKEDKPKGSYRRDEYPLKKAGLEWTKRNYLKLHQEYPDVAAAALMGTITFDEKKKQLIKTYAKDFKGKAPQDFLKLKTAK